MTFLSGRLVRLLLAQECPAVRARSAVKHEETSGEMTRPGRLAVS